MIGNCVRLAFCLAVSIISCAILRADDAEAKFFSGKILPILKTHCFECHSKEAEEIKGGLRLDTRAALLAGGESGPIVVAGEPDRSLLIQMLRYEEDDRQMPPRGKLDDAVIQDFTEWVKRGAFDPRSTPLAPR
jgi:hypothetical protein